MKSLTFKLLLLLGSLAASVAWAEPHHFHHGFHGPRVGIYVDPWPLMYRDIGVYRRVDYYPYPVYPQVIVEPAPPVVYMEREVPASSTRVLNSQPPEQSNDWYYCHNPEGYYPYIKSCSSSWQRVPAQPGSQR